jgi:predicted RNA binding protein YcfA (HicA-like mRNA interferase family)
MIIKTRKIDSALIRKGFVKKEKRGHIYYILYVKGKKTQIRTKLSHGSKEYNDGLLSAIRKQLKFNSKKELENFINCPLSEEEYISMLMDKSVIY